MRMQDTTLLARSQETSILQNLAQLGCARQGNALHIGINQYAILVVPQELRQCHTIAWERIDRLVWSNACDSIVHLWHIGYSKHTIAASALIAVRTIIHLTQIAHIDAGATATVPVNGIVGAIVLEHLTQHLGITTCTHATAIYNQHIYGIACVRSTETCTWVKFVPKAILYNDTIVQDLVIIVRTNCLGYIYQFTIKLNLKIEGQLVTYIEFVELCRHRAMTRKNGIFFGKWHRTYLLLHFHHFGLHHTCSIPLFPFQQLNLNLCTICIGSRGSTVKVIVEHQFIFEAIIIGMRNIQCSIRQNEFHRNSVLYGSDTPTLCVNRAQATCSTVGYRRVRILFIDNRRADRQTYIALCDKEVAI